MGMKMGKTNGENKLKSEWKEGKRKNDENEYNKMGKSNKNLVLFDNFSWYH